MSSKRGIPVWLVLVGAAVAGTTVGLVASFLREPSMDLELDEAAALAERAVPLGAPQHSGDDMAADPDILSNVPPYPNALPRRMVTGGKLLNAPYSVAWFHTDDTPGDVLAFYRRAMSDGGVLWTSAITGPQSGYVAWMRDINGTDLIDGGVEHEPMYSVTVMPQTGKTLVMLGKMFPAAMLAGVEPQLPEGVVLPKGASTPRIIELAGEGPGYKRQQIFAHLTDGELGQVDTFFQGHMKTNGWTVDTSQSTDERRVITGVRQNRTWSVALRKEGTQVHILMSNEVR